MKLLLTEDWHYTDKTPSCRIDDYPQTLKNKIQHILDIADQYDVDAILQPGDLTDTPFLSYFTYRKLFSLLSSYPIYTIYGQHDLRYRNKGNTPLDALNDSLDSFNIVPETGIVLGNKVDLYGASFEEEIPEIQNPKSFNILLIHKMIVHVALEEWEKQYDTATSFLSKTKFDLIVSGDNHQSFVVSEKNKNLVNCGSLMRSTIEQIDHQPCFYIFDTDKRSLQKFFIPIEPWKKVFDLEKKVKEEERNEDMESFVSGLTKHKDMGLHFEDNLYAYMKKNKISKDIQNVIERNKQNAEK
jgi:DNA repair exonuclease SbcCD nuclease subunit